MHTRGLQRDVVYLGWPLTNSAFVYEPKCGNAGGRGELRGLRQWVQLYRSPNKHWRSNSIFNLWCRQSISLFCHRANYATNPPLRPNSFQKQILFFTSIQSFCLYMSVQERNRVASVYWISVRNMRCSRTGLKLFLLGLWCKKLSKISLQKAAKINIQVQSSIPCAVLIEIKSKRRMGINVVGYIPKHHKCSVTFSSGSCDCYFLTD